MTADLDMALIVKRKRMMDSVGHYARPELLSLLWDDRPTAPMRTSQPSIKYGALRERMRKVRPSRRKMRSALLVWFCVLDQVVWYRDGM